MTIDPRTDAQMAADRRDEQARCDHPDATGIEFDDTDGPSVRWVGECAVCRAVVHSDYTRDAPADATWRAV